jgi:glycosyltransferase involved in cell wall biosynthesis
MKIIPTVSVIIPSRNEIYLQKTVEDILKNARGEIEVIVTLDGYWVDVTSTDARVTYLHLGNAQGMRNAINSAVAVAEGKYLLKCDAHVSFDPGFDLKLAADCEDNWVVVPRRKRLDAINWKILDNGKPDVDYEYLSFPVKDEHGQHTGLHGRVWEERAKKRKKLLIDDNMSAQGSCWFMHKSYYEYLELEDAENYGTFNHEFQEIGLKCWLSGGRVIVNKNTWYAHLHKDKTMGRGYSLDGKQLEKGTSYTNRWLKNTAWHKQTLPFSWLVEKFWPVPGWPEDWKEKI